MRNEEEWEFILRLTTNSTNTFWIGGKRSCEKCDTWEWIEGGRINFFKWKSGEPDNQGYKENCIEVRMGWMYENDWGPGTWNDEGCGSTIGFVCAWVGKKTP